MVKHPYLRGQGFQGCLLPVFLFSALASISMLQNKPVSHIKPLLSSVNSPKVWICLLWAPSACRVDDVRLLAPTGGDVHGWGEHELLLPAGDPEVPRTAGAAGSLRSGGGASEPRGSQAAETGRVWWPRYRQLFGLHPQGVLCGRHAPCISGNDAAPGIINSCSQKNGVSLRPGIHFCSYFSYMTGSKAHAFSIWVIFKFIAWEFHLANGSWDGWPLTSEAFSWKEVSLGPSVTF